MKPAYKKLSILRTGDFNGDDKGDIIWTDKSQKTVEVWIMNGLTVQQRQVIRSKK